MEQWLEVSVKVTREAEEAAAEIMRVAGAHNGVLLEYEEQAVTVTAYYPKDDKLGGRLVQIDEELKLVEERIGACRRGDILSREVDEESWINGWKPYFHVTRVGRHLVVKPAWEEYPARLGDLILDIDPGAAFGSGTHFTTALCLEELEQLVRPETKIVDVGTGSGILAIAAVKLGAREVWAVDISSTAVRQARENIIRNQVEGHITVVEGDLLHGAPPTADLIVANILADVVIGMLPSVPGKLNPGGVFLTSGIIDERVEDVLAAAAQCGLSLQADRHRGGWAALVFGKSLKSASDRG